MAKALNDPVWGAHSSEAAEGTREVAGWASRVLVAASRCNGVLSMRICGQSKRIRGSGNLSKFALAGRHRQHSGRVRSPQVGAPKARSSDLRCSAFDVQRSMFPSLPR